MKRFERLFMELDNSISPEQHWHDFIVMTACFISSKSFVNNRNPERVALGNRIIERHSEKDIVIFKEMLAIMADEYENHPDQDFLGKMYARLGFSDDFTEVTDVPYSTCKVSAKRSIPDRNALLDHLAEQGSFCYEDNCVGSGTRLIAAVNTLREALTDTQHEYYLCAICIGADKDFVTALTAYIQLSLRRRRHYNTG